MYTVTSVNDSYEGNTSEYETYQAAVDAARQTAAAGYDVKIERSSDNCICWASEDSPILKWYEECDNEQWVNLTKGIGESSDKPSVYFDIDGTLGMWYQDTRGMVYPDQVLNPHYHYFRNIEPHPFMIELAYELYSKGYDVCTISSSAKDTIRDKWEWLEDHCPFIKDENRFFCPLGADKNEFIKGNAEKSVLIDDYKVNLEQWKGTPIKAINSINSASKDMICIDGNKAETTHTLQWDKLMKSAIQTVSAVVDRKQICRESYERN